MSLACSKKAGATSKKGCRAWISAKSPKWIPPCSRCFSPGCATPRRASRKSPLPTFPNLCRRSHVCTAWTACCPPPRRTTERHRGQAAREALRAVGLKNVGTGDTICDEKHPITLESIEFAVPVISVAVEPKTKADQEKMGLALAKLAQEDPTFKVHTDPDSGQTIISGMGELHLEIIVDRMMREYKV